MYAHALGVSLPRAKKSRRSAEALDQLPARVNSLLGLANRMT